MARKTILKAWPIAALFAAGALCLAAPAAADAGIQVEMNQAKIVKLARPADTIVVGNPAIADAAVQDASTIILTGKGFGASTVTVLDRLGSPVQARRSGIAQTWDAAPGDARPPHRG